jgi:hypothetical protein
MEGTVSEPYPTSGPLAELQRSQPPTTVRLAVRLMFAGAGLEVVALLVAVVTTSSLKTAIFRANPHYNTVQVHNVEVARTTVLVIGALITIGLWLWMAWANDRGRGWARIVAAVLFGVNTLDLLVSIDVVHATATVIVGGVIWLVGLAALLLLFHKRSNPFYVPRAARPVRR